VDLLDVDATLVDDLALFVQGRGRVDRRDVEAGGALDDDEACDVPGRREAAANSFALTWLQSTANAWSGRR
jgi:hypothetical protein